MEGATTPDGSGIDRVGAERREIRRHLLSKPLLTTPTSQPFMTIQYDEDDLPGGSDLSIWERSQDYAFKHGKQKARWEEANVEHRKKYFRTHYLKNKEKILARAKANKGAINAKRRERRKRAI